MEHVSSIGGTQDGSNAKDKTGAQESLRLIDEQIVTHELSIIRLKTQRNELAPISRLPHEVLGIIFVFAVARARNTSSRPSSWFIFSYVCRLWRNVALTTPSIWCFIPLIHQKWATAILERSKTTDLMLDLNFFLHPTFSPPLQFMKGVLDNHTSRIRELNFKGLSPWTLSTLLKDIPPSSFRLRSLQLVGNDDTHLNFPTNLIANPENLRYLDVAKCEIAWYSMPLNGLTSLGIVSMPNRPQWVDFITALNGMPNLTTLDMRDSLPLALEVHRKTTQRIRLANLQQLSLGSTTDVNEIRNFLPFILVPRLATITIEVGAEGTGYSKNTDLISDLVTSLSAFISETIPESENDKPMSYQTLQVESSIFGQLNVGAWREEVDPDDPHIFPPDLDLLISLTHITEKMLQECTKHLPLSRLKTLHSDTDISTPILVACFGNLPQLQNVTVSGCVTSSFIEALMKSGNRRRQSLTFPALQSLEIRDAIFSSDHEGGFSFKRLQDCLIDRCNHNAPMQKLSLFNCFCLYKEHVKLLRKIVVDLNWDEYEEDYHSEEDHENDIYCDYYSDGYNSSDGWDLDSVYSF